MDLLTIASQVGLFLFGLYMTYTNKNKKKYIKDLELTVRKYEIEEVVKDGKIQDLQEEVVALKENCDNMLHTSLRREERERIAKEKIKAISSGSTRIKLKIKEHNSDHDDIKHDSGGD